ncbi:MAG: hypothetical protein IPJ20_18450 [Flammeovirgaceae bacterium]|nr:hypothetical protein [Flammeovirgaceae bacterium]
MPIPAILYTGSTTANQGTLRIAAFGGVIPDGSALIVNSTLDLNGYSETVGSLAGSGTVTSNAGATMTLTAGGDNTSTSLLWRNPKWIKAELAYTKQEQVPYLCLETMRNGTTRLIVGTLNINSASTIRTSALTIFNGTKLETQVDQQLRWQQIIPVTLSGDFFLRRYARFKFRLQGNHFCSTRGTG